MRRTTSAATNSKNHSRYPSLAPATIDIAKGAWVSCGDIDDNRSLVDLVSGLGAVLLGHAHDAVALVMADRAWAGFSYPLPSLLEEQVAERLCSMLPWDGAEMVRYSKNGRDATVAAVRLARAVTGREKCVYVDYHGADDMFMTEPPWNAGMVPHGTIKASCDELLTTHVLRDAACVILEPYPANAPEEIRDHEFFDELRAACDMAGAFMILDEMVSFGRAPTGSGVGALSIEPDLVVAGKCIANGMPLTAVVGPRRYIERYAVDVFHSATHSGEVVSLAAADATLRVIVDDDVTRKVNSFGCEMVDLFDEYESDRAKWHYPARMVFDFTRGELGTLLEHGVLCSGFANWTLAHAEDPVARETIMNAFRAVLSA